jgi:hypothetical protein
VEHGEGLQVDRSQHATIRPRSGPRISLRSCRSRDGRSPPGRGSRP